MKIIWVLLLLAVIATVAYTPRKSKSDDNVDEKGKLSKKKPQQVLGDDSSSDDEAVEDKINSEEEEKLAKKNKAKKEKNKKEKLKKEIEESESENDDDAEYEACTGTSNEPSDELCHCDMNEIDCSRTVLDSDDPRLRTANLEIQKPDFVPYIANFSENGITRLQEKKVLPGFEKSVAVLDFSNNEIRFIDAKTFQAFQNLSKLNLANNNLQQVKKDWFSTLGQKLHRLDLSNNKIKRLTDKMFEDLKNLKQLILDGNQIKEWKKEYFQGLDNLEQLSLDNCKISELPGDLFEYLPKLTGLSLRSNPIAEIPRAVSNSQKLTTLDLSETNIAEIHEKSFAGAENLEELIMENSKYLSVIRDCGFCGLVKMKTLILSGNTKLVEIHPNAFGFLKSSGGEKAAAIVELELQNSNLTTISDDLLNYDNLETFKIGGNPWNCTCQTVFLMDSKRFTYNQDVSFPKCAAPTELKNRNLATLHDYEACEAIRKVHKSSRLGTVLTLVLLVIFSVLGVYHMVTSGKLRRMMRTVQNVPEVSYSNLTNRDGEETITLEQDFEARPAEV